MSVEILDVVALSPLQRGLYSVSTLTGDVDPYLVTFSVRIDGLADPAPLRQAFDAVLQRYPHLGGAVVSDGMPHPVLVVTADGRIDWNDVDLRDAADPDSAAVQLYWDAGRTRIDLDNGPLFRVTAARVGDQCYELICSAHHIVVDGWSIPLLFTDLIALYSGVTDLPPAPPLREHAAWLASRDTAASISVWTDALADLIPMPMIGPPSPADLDLPVIGEARFDRTATESIAGWARTRGLTMNTVLQLAWARTLSGLTGRDDVVFGQTTSGRDSSLPNADRIVGALVTTIPVRVRIDERDPAAIGAELQRDVARLRAHEYLGIADITRHAGVGQLFDTLLVFENSPTGSVSAQVSLGDGACLAFRRIDSPSHYPIAVVPVVAGGELICRVEVRPDLVARFDPDRLARRVLAAVLGIVDASRACDADILLDDEPAVLVSPHRISNAHRSVPNALFAAADGAPGATAVIDDAGEQTFGEFGSAVRALAANLRAGGLQPREAVAVMLPRDRRVLQAPFAVGHAGGVCVHVDPATPADRVAYLLETARVRIVLADESSAGVLADVRAQGVDVIHAVPDVDGGVVLPRGSSVALPASTEVDDPFYVVFTSGTTGRPKGVVTSHRALLNHWSNHERRIFTPSAAQAGRRLRVGHGWSTGFDAAWQPTVALLSGHAVVLLGEQARTDAEQIVEAIDRHGIDILDTSPSMLNRLVDAGLFTSTLDGESCALSVLALGGEAISHDTWTRLKGLTSTRVINFYGPTEATVEALMADVDAHDDPTIGGPFDGMAAEVLDHRLRPVPPGGQGELYLSGAQLALGYLGRPGTTASAFVACRGGRRYRTGDLVRRNSDGTVVYEGRIDSQVKINGYRVEPAEGAVVLRELDGVQHAEALAFVENGRTRLGALVVSDLPIVEIRSAMAKRLPQFLIPTRIVQVARIPLNRNDKLDVHLATSLLVKPIGAGVAVEPATDTEHELLAIIDAMADGGKTGVLDSLLDLGIDSIGVIDLVSRLRGADYPVTAHDVVAAADIRDLARRLDELVALGPDAAVDVIPAGTLLPSTPLAREILSLGHYRYLAQTQLIELPPDVTVDLIVDRLESLAVAHPTLRSRLATGPDQEPVLIVGETSSAASHMAVVDDAPGDSAALLAATVERLDPDAGHMIAATVLRSAGRCRLLLSVHHSAIDVVSWLIVLDDLRRMERGEAPLNEKYVETPAFPAERPDILGAPLGGRFTDPAIDKNSNAVHRVVEFDADATERLLDRYKDYRLEDVLLRACALTFADAGHDGRVAVTRESHGRAADDDSRRVGWFTVEETTLVPLDEDAEWMAADGRGQIRLNHLGRFDVLSFGSGPWSPIPFADFTAEFGVAGHPDLPLRFSADVSTAVVLRDGRPCLVTQFSCNAAVLDETEVEARAATWLAVLGETIVLERNRS
ncbi:AMP-binding protein [Antrihabitans cavernicola]|uniref:AMP-binding protein n=1 Tax=Antrihabitans cavernicola TaxID=2495913 RepID=A0A5A7S8M2_9NOCA|nr:AMP-binding protein [Spelaeibacter cavernicola]KAA0021549.1 AMP-binding protein [Spelaeibacter cavernicola]